MGNSGIASFHSHINAFIDRLKVKTRLHTTKNRIAIRSLKSQVAHTTTACRRRETADQDFRRQFERVTLIGRRKSVRYFCYWPLVISSRCREVRNELYIVGKRRYVCVCARARTSAPASDCHRGFRNMRIKFTETCVGLITHFANNYGYPQGPPTERRDRHNATVAK
jgi:hypothetical protein